MTPFSDLVARSCPMDGALQVRVPEDWMQGRSVFGGLQAALGLQGIRSLVPERPLRSLQVNFIAPMDGIVNVRTKVLREGKNSSQVQAELYNESGVTTQILGVLGSSRSSVIEVQMAPPAFPDTDVFTFPVLPGVTPNFLQHYDLRQVQGQPPFSGRAQTEAVFKCNIRDEGLVSELHLVALADVVPPLGLSFLDTFAFGSTMSWMLDLLVEAPLELPRLDWTIETQLTSAANGYNHQSSTLWSPDGTAVALSRQCMLVFG